MRHLMISLLAMLVFLLVIAAAESYGQSETPQLDESLPLPPLPSKPSPAATPMPMTPPMRLPAPAAEEKVTPATPSSPQPGPAQPMPPQPARAVDTADDAALEAVFGAEAAAEMKAAQPKSQQPDAKQPETANASEPPAKAPSSIDRLPPRQSFSFNSLYDGRLQRNPIGTYAPRTPDEAPWINDPLGNAEQAPGTGILRSSSSIYRGKSPIFRDRTGRNLVEQQLLDQGYGVTGKLPILPQKPDPSVTDAAGNVLPSIDPRRNLSSPTLGNARTTRNPVIRNRLSPTQRIQEPLYRGPSRPGMIAPRAQQERLTPNARRLGNP